MTYLVDAVIVAALIVSYIVVPLGVVIVAARMVLGFREWSRSQR